MSAHYGTSVKCGESTFIIIENNYKKTLQNLKKSIIIEHIEYMIKLYRNSLIIGL